MHLNTPSDSFDQISKVMLFSKLALYYCRFDGAEILFYNHNPLETQGILWPYGAGLDVFRLPHKSFR